MAAAGTEPTRATWTDNRLDDVARNTESGFARVDARFDKVDARIDRVEARIDHLAERTGTGLGRIDSRIDDPGRIIIRGAFVFAGAIVALAAAITAAGL